MIAGCVWGLRRTPRLITPSRRESSDALVDAERRLRAGEPVVLRPSKRRAVFLVIVFLALMGAAVWGLVTTPSVVAALVALLFGAIAALCGLRLVPGRMYLRIDSDGLLVHGPYKSKRWRWNDIGNFEAYEITQAYGVTNKLVGFTRRDVDPRRQGVWKTMNRSMSGVDVTLPDTYGLRHVDLADLLDAAHARYATQFGPNPAELELAIEAAHVRQDRLPAARRVTRSPTVGGGRS